MLECQGRQRNLLFRFYQDPVAAKTGRRGRGIHILRRDWASPKTKAGYDTTKQTKSAVRRFVFFARASTRRWVTIRFHILPLSFWNEASKSPACLSDVIPSGATVVYDKVHPGKRVVFQS